MEICTELVLLLLLYGETQDGMEATKCAWVVASGEANNGSVDHIWQICSPKLRYRKDRKYIAWYRDHMILGNHNQVSVPILCWRTLWCHEIILL